MSSPIKSATTQALVMNAASNAFAQGWTAYQNKSLSSIDPASFIQFLALSILVTPPNYIFQRWMEDTFPTNPDPPTAKNPEPKLSITNTVIKFFMDQSLGCWTNTLLFIVIMGMFKGKDAAQIIMTIRRDFWGMVFASYKLWPMVCLLNLLVVPFEHRMLVGNTAAFGWGIYISLTAA